MGEDDVYWRRNSRNSSSDPVNCLLGKTSVETTVLASASVVLASASDRRRIAVAQLAKIFGNQENAKTLGEFCYEGADLRFGIDSPSSRNEDGS